MNKRGWIKIVEAFVAILLIAIILLLVVNQSNLPVQKKDSEIYEKELNMLRKVEINSTLREDILSANIPIMSIETNFPSSVENALNTYTPSYLICFSKICSLHDKCTLEGAEIEIKEDIYSTSVPIFADAENYSPRQLKLFCWMRQV